MISTNKKPKIEKTSQLECKDLNGKDVGIGFFSSFSKKQKRDSEVSKSDDSGSRSSTEEEGTASDSTSPMGCDNMTRATQEEITRVWGKIMYVRVEFY